MAKWDNLSLWSIIKFNCKKSYLLTFIFYRTYAKLTDKQEFKWLVKQVSVVWMAAFKPTRRYSRRPLERAVTVLFWRLMPVFVKQNILHWSALVWLTQPRGEQLP